ncbi:MAG: hypothetical protein EA351_07845 [Gemmatimonadales bacterium]|nr:MAG: hypothetical protein EA351_07845 [Gemmatimonadales bacterium]
MAHPKRERSFDPPLVDLQRFPLMQALFGRRARRFGMGMEIPSGPLAFRSRHDPLPLSELETAVLIAAGTGVSGWNFGVPFGPRRPSEHGHFTHRYTGRTAPTAAGIGTPVLFHTDDRGIHLTDTRDVEPSRIRELETIDDDAERILAVCREHTRQLGDRRLDLPSEPGHMLEPNLWMANAPGSTLFMPMGDASEQLLGLMAIFIDNGYTIMDDRSGRPAGSLAPFHRSGLLDESKPFPLTVLEQSAYEANCMELAFMGHNIVLTMQAMGLGGLFYNGLNRWSVLGAGADQGVQGLGFRFVRDERWTVPEPVGLDGHYEGLCPPYHPHMRSAVEAFMERKFGPKGAYDPGRPGPWKESRRVKGGVTPYTEEFIDCMTEVAQYVLDTFGKFPGTVPTMVLTGFVQAQHIDTDYYDTHFEPGAYLETHADHMERWHGPGAEPSAPERPTRS